MNNIDKALKDLSGRNARISDPDEFTQFIMDSLPPKTIRKTHILTNEKKKIMIKKIAAIIIIALSFSGVVLATIYQRANQHYKEQKIDTSVKTEPMVSYVATENPKQKFYVISLCPGTWVKQSDGKEYIEEESGKYRAFEHKSGTLTMQLDGKTFDMNSLPKLTNKDLKKIESTCVNGKTIVNLITKETKIPVSVTGSLPRAMTILLPGNGAIYYTDKKAVEGNWLHCTITSWEKTSSLSSGIAGEFERVKNLPGFHAYIYSSTETSQKDIDRATSILKKVGIQNISYKKDIPVRHFTDSELRQWAQDEKKKGTPYGKLYEKMAPQGMTCQDVEKQWHIVKSVYNK